VRMVAILWLIIISDGVAAAIGARAAWRLQFQHARPELATAFAVGFAFYAIASFGSVCNSALNGNGLVLPPGSYLAWAMCFRALQSIGMWAIVLTLMNGNPGFIRRTLFRLLRRF